MTTKNQLADFFKICETSETRLLCELADLREKHKKYKDYDFKND
ncbi:MAG: hypothetical protein ACI97N_002005 [Cognaticolwellia sp.]|jgi:hypothetical protein|tara:strand:- start:508 stop:639 length:132 start_codon:yes stop_codon:yes gene_type:complete